MVKLKYVRRLVSKGRVYYYFRKGEVQVRLPDNPDSPEFSQAYWKARTGGQQRKIKTSFSALIDSYYQTPTFKNKARGTQANYRRDMEYLRSKNGDKDFTKLRRKDVIAARDAHADTWRKANGLVECISYLARHAIDMEWIVNNPATGVTKLQGGSYEPWPDTLLVAYEHHCDEHQLKTERQVYELAVGTGQRIGDILTMRWEQFDDEGFMSVIQEKTGQFVQVYCPPRLQTFLAPLREDKGYIFPSNRGGHLAKRSVQKRIQDVRKMIGADDFVIHGWRYNAAKALAEAGCTDAQIQAVTGHRTLTMAQKYRSQAERKKLSRDAQTMRGVAESGKLIGKPAKGRKED